MSVCSKPVRALGSLAIRPPVNPVGGDHRIPLRQSSKQLLTAQTVGIGHGVNNRNRTPSAHTPDIRRVPPESGMWITDSGSITSASATRENMELWLWTKIGRLGDDR